MRVIGQAHTLVHKNGVVRVQTDIRAGTRTDKKQSFADKVAKVEEILAADSVVEERTVKSMEKNTLSAEQEEEVAKMKGKESAEKVPSTTPKNTGTWASMLRK